MLEFRADYIKTLQDVDNVNKTRLVLHAKELDDARRQLKTFEKEFEKFKACHAEEKGNFKKLLQNLGSENTKLKTELDMYKKLKTASKASQK